MPAGNGDSQRRPTSSRPTFGARASSIASSYTLAINLSATLVGSVLAGGGLGWLLDRWLHKDFVFTLIFGALGFAGGIASVIRTVLRQEKRSASGANRRS
jgi:ATP synthase protein I